MSCDRSFREHRPLLECVGWCKFIHRLDSKSLMRQNEANVSMTRKRHPKKDHAHASVRHATRLARSQKQF
jgi:hypothetical protein